VIIGTHGAHGGIVKGGTVFIKNVVVFRIFRSVFPEPGLSMKQKKKALSFSVERMLPIPAPSRRV